MSTYDFTLIFSLPDAAADPDDFLDALFEAGCDDALVGIGEMGSVALDFSRDAATAKEALDSAIEDVKKAIPGADLIEASPDLVSLSDMADQVGCSRQNMRKYAVGKTYAFPKPVHVGKTSLWHLYEVAGFLRSQSSNLEIPDELLEVSKAALLFNIKNQEERYKRL